MTNLFEQCLIFHAIGDIIGFYNGHREFNTSIPVSKETTRYMVDEVILNGGISRMNLEGYMVSDDTMMHQATARALLKDNGDIKNFIDILRKEYIYLLKDPKFEHRAYGLTTIESLKLLKSGTITKIPYQSEKKGNGACMRVSCIGVAFAGEKNRSKLITYALESARLTHNSATGMLSAITVALFTAFACEQVNLLDWPYNMLAIVKDDYISNYIKKTRPEDYENYQRDKYHFIDAWERYCKIRISTNVVEKELIEKKTLHILTERVKWIYDNFNPNRFNKNSSDGRFLKDTGSTGEDGPIFAYESLLTTVSYGRNSWETLCYLSMIHAGDSDTVGAMAAAWYGVFNKLYKTNVIFAEKQEIIELSKELVKKFSSF
jgi:ADP-ribosylarginine hydrolase